MPASAELANAQLKDKSGKAVGDVDLMQTPGGVLLKLSLKGMPAGEHAFHIHAVGKCEAPFEFGGPAFQSGQPQARHDVRPRAMPATCRTCMCRRAASSRSRSSTPRSRWRRASRTRVLDSDGSSIVIHAKADDYKSDPAGNAGDRIACGVIQQSGARRRRHSPGAQANVGRAAFTGHPGSGPSPA